MAGYKSASDVGPHAKIDLDMAEFETAVGTHSTDTEWITKSMFIFDNGGNGLCQQTDVDAATAGTATPWCTDTTKALGNSQKSTSVRTIRGFATSGESKMMGWTTYPIYYAYWDDYNYADTFITKDYSATVKPSGWNQLIKKGANYQAVWMYVLHELEDAIGDCYAGDITANDNTPTGGAPHAWDEGWAFYAGSTVGQTVAQSVTDVGTLIFELAEKRSGDFKTDHSTGPATTNVHLLAKFIEGRDLIIAGKCAEAEPLIDDIIKQMSIPLIQGTLKYAYNSDPKTTTGYCTADADKTALTSTADCAKAWAEGWAFAAAILPRIDQCSATAAATIKTNIEISASKPMAGGFAAVKTAMESTYPCLGITCADVGAYTGTTVCTDPVASSDAATAPALALGAAAAAAGAALLL